MTQKTKIRVWQIKNGITHVSIAKKVGVSPQLVSMVVGGQRINQKVVDAFISVGCPSQYFSLGSQDEAANR
jgi:hypothetical protein